MSEVGNRPFPAEVTVWTDAGRAELASQVLDLMGSAVLPIGVGGPRVREVEQLAEQLDCPREDDLRKLLVDRPAAFVLLASVSPIQNQDVSEAVAAGTTVLTLEPFRSGIARRAGAERSIRRPVPVSAGRIELVPRFDQGEGWHSAADPTQVLGAPRLMRLSTCGGPRSTSLFARLYDAWRTVLAFGRDLPESIDASLVGPLTEVPDDLRAMTGHLSAHARLGSGGTDCSAVIEASDRSGRTARELCVVGESGYLRVGDLDYELYDDNGEIVDRQEAGDRIMTDADLIAGNWRKLIDQPHTGSLPPKQDDDGPILACCLACLLSARTHEAESPGKLAEAHRGR